jgi:hypothetical protein
MHTMKIYLVTFYDGETRPRLHTDNPCQIYTFIESLETRLIRREVRRKYTIKIAIKHAHAWNWVKKGGRNLCHKPKQQNQVHEHQCNEMEKMCEDI